LSLRIWPHLGHVDSVPAMGQAHLGQLNLLSSFFTLVCAVCMRSVAGRSAVFLTGLDLVLAGVPERSALQTGHFFDPLGIRSPQDGHSILTILSSFVPQLGHVLLRPAILTPHAGQCRTLSSGGVISSKRVREASHEIGYCVHLRNVPCAGG